MLHLVPDVLEDDRPRRPDLAGIPPSADRQLVEGCPRAADGRRRAAGCPFGCDDGMATAEYAVATLAACAFAGLLLVIVRSEQVRELLLGIITRALAIG